MTLVEKATDAIQQMIMTKAYDENGYLPCEGNLCTILKVSRSTIREAVKELEVRGYVKRIHGKGIMVSYNSLGALKQTLSDVMLAEACSMDELIDLRMTIECAAARKACSQATQDDIQRMSQCVNQMEEAAVMDEVYFSNDLTFHIAMVDASKNHLFSAIVKAYQPLIKNAVIAASQCDYVIEKKHHYHRTILHAISTGDSKAAAKAVYLHLKATEKNTRMQLHT